MHGGVMTRAILAQGCGKTLMSLVLRSVTQFQSEVRDTNPDLDYTVAARLGSCARDLVLGRQHRLVLWLVLWLLRKLRRKKVDDSDRHHSGS